MQSVYCIDIKCPTVGHFPALIQPGDDKNSTDNVSANLLPSPFVLTLLIRRTSSNSRATLPVRSNKRRLSDSDPDCQRYFRTHKRRHSISFSFHYYYCCGTYDLLMNDEKEGKCVANEPANFGKNSEAETGLSVRCGNHRSTDLVIVDKNTKKEDAIIKNMENNSHFFEIGGSSPKITTRIAIVPPLSPQEDDCMDATSLKNHFIDVCNDKTRLQLARALKLRLTTDQHLLKIPKFHIVDRISIVARSYQRSRAPSNAQHVPIKTGVHMNDGFRQVDFVLVYEAPQISTNNVLVPPPMTGALGITGVDEAARQRNYFLRNLRREGLVLETDPPEHDPSFPPSSYLPRMPPTSSSPAPPHPHLIFIKVYASWETLCRGAEMLQMKMPLKYRNASANVRRTFFAAGYNGNKFADANASSISVVANASQSFDEPPSAAKATTAKPTKAKGTGLFNALLSLFRFSDVERSLVADEAESASRVTAQFNRARCDQFLIEDRETFFSSTQRIQVVHDIMQQSKCDPKNPKKRGLQWLLRHGVFVAAYPPHDGETSVDHLNPSHKSLWSKRQILRLTWANFHKMFKPQPLNLVRQYFGEKIAFYFAWLGFYTKMLIFPSIVGIVSFFYGIFSLPSNPIRNEICNNDSEPGNLTMCPVCRVPNCDPWILASHCDSAEWNYRFDHESHIFVAIFTLLWATTFLELWKRRETELACEWNCFDSRQDEGGMRPEFEARSQLLRVSPITNEEEPYASKIRRCFWLAQSLSGMLFLIMLVIAAVISLIAARIWFYSLLKGLGGIWQKMQFEFASLAVHVLTFLVVMTLAWIYEKVAHRLTEVECPRTQADYLTSYIWKVFIFEILNNFAPIFYAAMIRGRNLDGPSQQSYIQEMCDPGGCLNEVVQAISILLLARLLISNAAELGFPFLRSLWRDMRLNAASLSGQETEAGVLNIPWWHKDYVLNEPKLDGVYAEYLEMLVQFGYVTLFVAAFPLAPLICLLNNLVEIRLDATNYVMCFRRPLPVRDPGIRIWRRCMGIIVKLAVLCNGGFLAFTSELVPQMIYRNYYSKDGSLNGYVEFTLAKFNTSQWKDFKELHPQYDHCYFRDFRDKDNPNAYSIIWWQIMVARLSFFTIFILFFYFFQWICEFLIADVPEAVQVRLERENFTARQAFYGSECRSIDPNSATPTRRTSRATVELTMDDERSEQQAPSSMMSTVVAESARSLQPTNQTSDHPAADQSDRRAQWISQSICDQSGSAGQSNDFASEDDALEFIDQSDTTTDQTELIDNFDFHSKWSNRQDDRDSKSTDHANNELELFDQSRDSSRPMLQSSEIRESDGGGSETAEHFAHRSDSSLISQGHGLRAEPRVFQSNRILKSLVQLHREAFSADQAKSRRSRNGDLLLRRMGRSFDRSTSSDDSNARLKIDESAAFAIEATEVDVMKLPVDNIV